MIVLLFRFCEVQDPLRHGKQLSLTVKEIGGGLKTAVALARLTKMA